MPSPTRARRRRLSAPILATALLAPLALLAPVASASASPAPSESSASPVSSGAAGLVAPAARRAPRHVARIADKPVVFKLTNTASDLAQITSCGLAQPDGGVHAVRGRLVGPAAVLADRTLPPVVDVLVHDAGTGGWFWDLKQAPRYDYARQLAHRGHTTLVLDLLGYGPSHLVDGRNTCLGAQVAMLHQTVQNLLAGLYRYDLPGRRIPPPIAGRVVVTGHGTGATLAQLEAATYRDTAATVLMSPATTADTSTGRSVEGAIARGQASTCSGSTTYAPFGTAAQFRSAMFRTAPAAVRRQAVRLRRPTPCGDVSSLSATLLAQAAATSKVPTLVLRGAGSPSGSPAITAPTTTRTLAHTGDALPLERSAPRLRSIVLSWLSRRGLR